MLFGHARVTMVQESACQMGVCAVWSAALEAAAVRNMWGLTATPEGNPQ